MSTAPTERVLVTGASGYIAGHVIKLLQEEGYSVRGTVRSLKNEAKIKHLHNLCPGAKHPLELVEADLDVESSWQPAVKDMMYVVHVASPFPLELSVNEDELIRQAREGTLAVLRACANEGSVKRVVLTSSVAAVDNSPQSNVIPLTEQNWSDVTQVDAYSKSKTLAEKAAWVFVKDLPEQKKFELVVINPAFVQGPVLHGSSCTSIVPIKRMLERQMPMLPALNFNIVDVRDVALAHVRAMTLPEAAGNRFICSNVNLWFSQMALLLDAVFRPQGYNVPTCTAPKLILRVVSLFDKSLRSLLPQVGVVHTFDNSKMRQVLKVEPRDVRDTIIEMAHSLIQGGFVKTTPGYRGPGGPEERQLYMAVKL
ncbi:hypothetical protein C0Q70_21094 [Pomacea canaliculata]|uniref:NAD-dependent epimerase/dehydratase domain-containing protein n=1 Tax=Pomacea canaliculata TaxID=400727 RepID=A0A2T7NBJ4_POMCA|nr:hypothetical protein C0Q70_21094 [Pomacea canaliculata]